MNRGRLFSSARRLADCPPWRSSFNKAARLRPSVALPSLLSQKPVERIEGEPDDELYRMLNLHPKMLKSTMAADDPLLVDDYFHVNELVDIVKLFEAKAFWGHKVGTLHSSQKESLYGQRLDTCVIDLEQTARQLHTALNFIAHVAHRDGIILFVAHDRRNMLAIETAARECHQFAHVHRWMEGTLTNSTRKFGGDIRLPDCIVLTSCSYLFQQQHPAIVEAAKMCIPTVGVCDTNIDSRLVTYPIAGNDDSVDTTHMWLALFKEAVERGRNNLCTPQIVVEEQIPEEKISLSLERESRGEQVGEIAQAPQQPPIAENPTGTPLKKVKTKTADASAPVDKKTKFRRILEQLNREAAAQNSRDGD